MLSGIIMYVCMYVCMYVFYTHTYKCVRVCVCVAMYTIHMLCLKLFSILTQRNVDQDSSDHDSDSGSEDAHDGGGITVSNFNIPDSNFKL